MDDIQKIMTRWFENYSLSFSLGDISPTKEVTLKMDEYKRNGLINVEEILYQINYGIYHSELDSKYLYEKITIEGYEYINFMCFGFNKNTLSNAGFHKVNLDSLDLIIPIHFAPFVSNNIQINFFADTDQLEKIRICGADGDQDRPC